MKSKIYCLLILCMFLFSVFVYAEDEGMVESFEDENLNTDASEPVSFWKRISLAFVSPVNCPVRKPGFRATYLEGVKADGTIVKTYGAQCNVGEYIEMVACTKSGDVSGNNCDTVFEHDYEKESSDDKLNVLTECAGGSCYEQNWYINAIDNKYVGYNCKKCTSGYDCTRDNVNGKLGQYYCYDKMIYKCTVDDWKVEDMCNVLFRVEEYSDCAIEEVAQDGMSGLCKLPTEIYTCSDTDGGNNKGTKGTVTLYLDGVVQSTYTDKCEGDILKEGMYTTSYCEQGFIPLIDIYCVTYDQKCEDGKCVATGLDDSCSDSDGGKKYDQKGTVTYVVDGVSYSDDDWCARDEGDIDKKLLIENYCSNTEALVQDYSCDFECKDGKCVKESCRDECSESEKGCINIKVPWDCEKGTDECYDRIDQEQCSGELVCVNGECKTQADCSTSADCNDNNKCTNDICTSTKKCLNEPKRCEKGEVCDEDTGECISVQDCKAYQEKVEGKCAFSFTKLFTTAGFEAFWQDFTWQIVVVGILILIIIGIIIMYGKNKSSGGGF